MGQVLTRRPQSLNSRMVSQIEARLSGFHVMLRPNSVDTLRTVVQLATWTLMLSLPRCSTPHVCELLTFNSKPDCWLRPGGAWAWLSAVRVIFGGASLVALFLVCLNSLV